MNHREGSCHILVCVLFGSAILMGPSLTSAAVGLGITPSFPSQVTVGQTGVPASLQITNTSTPPDSVGNVTITSITLVPSCGAVASSNGDCPAASDDPGVLQLSATGSGAAGTACAGMTFTMTIVDPVQGKYQFGSASPVVLSSPATIGSACSIDFTFDVLKRPSKDANPIMPGLQTVQIGYASGMSALIGSLGSGMGTSSMTVNRSASSTALTTACPTTFVANQTFTMTAKVTGASPTGTSSFFDGGVGISGCAAVSLSGGSANCVTSTLPTGADNLTATYGGDANNEASNSPSLSVMVLDPNDVLFRNGFEAAITGCPNM